MQKGGKHSMEYIKGQERKRIGHHNRHQIIQTTKI
jgi:hypothetical protein